MDAERLIALTFDWAVAATVVIVLAGAVTKLLLFTIGEVRGTNDDEEPPS